MVKYKSLVVALMMTVSSLSAASVTASAADGSYDMKVSVNLDGEKKKISPYIYGVNDFLNDNNTKNLTVNALRQGGNRYSGYNWETNHSNAGSDWLYSSDTHLGDISDGAAYNAKKLSEIASKKNVSYKMATLQMAGYVAADKAGSVSVEESAPSERWNKVVFKKDGAFSDEPDLTDDVVYMDEYVNYLVKNLGGADTASGIQAYSLDNEPALWHHTHVRMHPQPVGITELAQKSIELASAVKAVDPKAEIFGPALYGYTAFDHLADDDNSDEWEKLKAEKGYHWYLDSYLDDMKNAEDEMGMRLLDVLDIHYYSESARISNEDILQSVRTLYEKGFVENSWIGQWCQANVPILPTVQASIDNYYPGTKLAISEYNFEGGKESCGAIAQTEALGCFADHGVYFASYWGTMAEAPYVESAINLYTNYNGKGDAFGDTLVEAQTEDVSLATAYAAINGTDESDVTLVLSNKDMTNTEKAVISLDGTDTVYKSATVYAVTQDGSDIRVIDVQNDVKNNTVTVELPPLSVAQIVVSDELSDEKLYEAPDITIKEVVYNYAELEDSVNGFKMIPLGDLEHLTKAIINTTVTCDSGASWYSGGGALTFNNLISDEDGTSFWGAKSYMYSKGTTDTTVIFDGMFNDGKNDVNAKIGDTYSELQNWWAVSETDETGADVKVTYNTITLVYEYNNEASETLYGDINLDSSVTPADLMPFMYHFLNKKLTGQALLNADVLYDGEVKLTDLAKLKQYCVGDKVTLGKM